MVWATGWRIVSQPNADLRGDDMDVCVLTNVIYDIIPDYVAVSNRQKAEYCGKHNLGWIPLRVNPHPEAHPCWCKPSLMAWALQQYCWCVWMDADAMPVNMAIDIGSYLADVAEPVVMSKDINGFNAGVLAVRCDARDWLIEIDKRRVLPQYQRRFREQQAMADSINSGEVKCHIPPLNIGWNDYIQELYHRSCDPNIYRRGESWCLHLPAVRDDKRLEIMRGELL